MSRTVEFADVHRRITEFGERATLITVSGDNRPHVVTATIQIAGERLATRVGSRTAANLADRPNLTLTWPPLPGGEYMLILDGAAELVGEADADGVVAISIGIDRGILHRLAGLPDPGPSCVSL